MHYGNAKSVVKGAVGYRWWTNPDNILRWRQHGSPLLREPLPPLRRQQRLEFGIPEHCCFLLVADFTPFKRTVLPARAHTKLLPPSAAAGLKHLQLRAVPAVVVSAQRVDRIV